MVLLLSFVVPFGCSYTYQDYDSNIEVLDSPESVGRLVALDFIKWVEENPNGVVSLPTGKSAEYFVRYLFYFKKNWHKDSVRVDVEKHGISSKDFPETHNLKIVQSYEPYPVSSSHKRSVSRFIDDYYLKVLDIQPENALLMSVADQGILKKKGPEIVFRSTNIGDLKEFCDREPKSRIEKWQRLAIEEANDFCQDYEDKLKSWGGIQLYILPLGYNGDISLNVPGASADSKTRLVNVPSYLSSLLAKEMSSMDLYHKKIGITLGLGTLSINKDMKVILLINSGTKKEVIKSIVENRVSPDSPVSIINNHDTKIYMTKMANTKLNIISSESSIDSQSDGFFRSVDRVVINVALAKNKKIMELTEEDFEILEGREEKFLEKVKIPLNALKVLVVKRIMDKVQVDIPDMKAKKIMHAGVYHDDISLGYYPILRQLMRNNQNTFIYLTSGVNSVDDNYIASSLSRVDYRWINKSQHVLFDKRYYEVIDDFARSYWAVDRESTDLYDTIIVLKHLRDVFGIDSIEMLKETIRWLKDDYFPNKSNGDVDSPGIVKLKRKIRESEADKIGAINNIWTDHIEHLNLPFYSNEGVFHSIPTKKFDVEPLTEILKIKKPDIITMLDVPEDYGADAPYKAKIVLASAMRAAKVPSSTKVMTYKTHGYRYHIADADRIVLVSSKDLNLFVDAFNTCFLTQKKSMFPSPYYAEDSVSTVKVSHKELFEELKLLLGADALLGLGFNGQVGALSLRIQSGIDFIKAYDKIDSHQELRSEII